LSATSKPFSLVATGLLQGKGEPTLFCEGDLNPPPQVVSLAFAQATPGKPTGGADFM